VSSGRFAEPVEVEQPRNSELGAMIYEARLPWWMRIVFTVVLLPLGVVSAIILIRRWADLDWIAGAAFLFCALVLPFAIADGLVRRVRFYDHGLVTRNWAFQTRALRYSDVASVGRDQSLRIQVSQGAPIKIPKWEADFDFIEDVLEQRRASGDSDDVDQ